MSQLASLPTVFSSMIRECKKEELNVCQNDPTPSPGGICLSSVSKSPAPHTCSWISMALPKLGTGREPCDIDLFSPWQQQIKTTSRGEGRLLSRKLHDQYIPQAFRRRPGSPLSFPPLSQISHKRQRKSSTENFRHHGSTKPTAGRDQLTQQLLEH